MKILCLGALLVLPVAAMAQLPFVPYLGAQLHYSDLDIRKADLGVSGKQDSSDYGYALRAGAKLPIYSGHGYAGLEVAYVDLGEASIRNDDMRAKIEADAFELVLVGESEIFHHGYLFGRVGVAYWDADAVVTDADGRSRGSDTGYDLVVGGGISYHLSQWAPVELRAGFDRYRIDAEGAKGTNTDLISLGAYFVLR